MSTNETNQNNIVQHIVFLLDESGSMASMGIEPVQAVNKFIQDEFTKHFGTPAQRRTGKFPIYTSDSAMTWLKDLFKDETKIDAKTKKVILSKILNYNINGDKIVITPTKENPKAVKKVAVESFEYKKLVSVDNWKYVYTELDGTHPEYIPTRYKYMQDFLALM